jgi:predicted NAD/FAD-dependent oxidoreductase
MGNYWPLRFFKFIVMKKIILISAISTLSIGISMAQVRDSSKVTTRQSDGQLIAQPQPDLIKLKTSDIPSELRQTLQKSKYKGWENSMIYKQKSTNEYIVEIMENGKAKTYRFNEEGKPVKEGN